MLLLADVVRRHGPAYRERFGAAVLPSHVRALDDIARCRTPALGGHLAVCNHCDEEHVLYPASVGTSSLPQSGICVPLVRARTSLGRLAQAIHSCRNRACPRCGHDTTTRWLERQRRLLLPVPYFHVVFTLPDELRRLVRSHQRALVGALFRAAFDAVAALARDDHFLGAHIGALAVLHTWTRTLEWHPHVHMLVPAGGLAPDGRTWRPLPRRKRRFLAPVHALAKLFRGRFLALARRAVPDAAFPTIPWEKRWVVFAKPVAHGADKVLDYLGRYVHRTAMSDRALLAMDERTVTFRYRDSRDHRHKVLTLPADEMLRRFLQHVPPKGMHRVRAFGLLHPAERNTLRQLQLLLAPRRSGDEAPTDDSPPPRARTKCAHCGAPGLALVRRIEPDLAVGNEIAAAGVSHRARAPPSLDATAP